ITASYQFFVSGTDPATGPGSGTTGSPIYSFTVFQEGNLLRITDNNGATYEGNFGSVRTTGGADQNDPNPAGGDQIIAQYTARGTSAAGLTISIAGTFQGVVSGGGESFSLGDRRMYGTWIEDGGRNGDVNGQASPIGIVVPQTTDGGTTTTSE
ncbi:MAG: hypothetical protein K9N49_03295, partial [Candidatus Marinimicrobia bacterium]|nr:hypothetical protein [Candidatus Neomarinimicrobiota bacterium]